jgi:hypothetical protein
MKAIGALVKGGGSSSDEIWRKFTAVDTMNTHAYVACLSCKHNPGSCPFLHSIVISRDKLVVFDGTDNLHDRIHSRQNKKGKR